MVGLEKGLAISKDDRVVIGIRWTSSKMEGIKMSEGARWKERA